MTFIQRVARICLQGGVSTGAMVLLNSTSTDTDEPHHLGEEDRQEMAQLALVHALNSLYASLTLRVSGVPSCMGSSRGEAETGGTPCGEWGLGAVLTKGGD